MQNIIPSPTEGKQRHQFESCPQIPADPLASEIIAELEAAHKADLRRLSDLAFTFLNATDGDRAGAERLLDEAIDLLLEGGVLSTWRYREILNRIREGL